MGLGRVVIFRLREAMRFKFLRDPACAIESMIPFLLCRVLTSAAGCSLQCLQLGWGIRGLWIGMAVVLPRLIALLHESGFC